ncbi:HIT-like protein [Cristinia sonorae]|uniref:Bis(5'-adenosyl)-triphosphatase n=1 Tax=Cristinia sonorae TaxID=1940300 RepID=A0A8K0XSB3_9AGAR|nr:HIT-like protein [Cristinia sonorae]
MNRFLFSTIDVSRQVFYHTAQTFAIVNLKPILPGHILVSPRRVVPRLADLEPGELADLMHSVQHVGKVIETAYKAEGLTIACQDGPAAGQTVPHVHFHLLPRKMAGDPFEGHNDEIYPALEHAEESLPKQLLVVEAKDRDPRTRAEPIKMDADEDRKPRSLEDMEREANWLKELFAKS